MSTKVVTGSSAYKGGGEATGGTRGAATGSRGASSRTGSTGSGWVETGQPRVVVSPIWTWSLWGRGVTTSGLHFHAAGWASSHISHHLQDVQ